MSIKNKSISIFIYIINYIIFFTFITKLFANNNEQVDNIFIFIHGTWVYSNLSLLLKKFENKEIYNRWKNIIGKEAEQKGLIDITNINNEEAYLPREKIIIEYKKDNNVYPNSKYYKYNWDGFLSEKNRNNAAKILLNELLRLKKKFSNAKINIIGYSHGGNVALNMLRYIPNNIDNLEIENLILLATPIGNKTENLANKKNKNNNFYFKNIYCIYSYGDFTQIKDFLFNFPFCHRFLKNRIKNVHNIEIQYHFNGKSNNEKFIYLPNHKDFWIYPNKKRLRYRPKNYFPVIYFLPKIIKTANTSNHTIYKLEIE